MGMCSEKKIMIGQRNVLSMKWRAQDQRTPKEVGEKDF